MPNRLPALAMGRSSTGVDSRPRRAATSAAGPGKPGGGAARSENQQAEPGTIRTRNSAQTILGGGHRDVGHGRIVFRPTALANAGDRFDPLRCASGVQFSRAASSAFETTRWGRCDSEGTQIRAHALSGRRLDRKDRLPCARWNRTCAGSGPCPGTLMANSSSIAATTSASAKESRTPLSNNDSSGSCRGPASGRLFESRSRRRVLNVVGHVTNILAPIPGPG